MLGVRVAQLALGHTRLGADPLGGRLADAQREPGEREPPEQVVVVRVRCQQPVRAEAGLRQQRRQQLELVGEVRRVDQERLLAVADRGRGRLPDPARDDERLRMDGDGSQATFSSFAASRRVLTSSVGFFWLFSSFCPRRLTQITGTLVFRHGSTSVS